MSDDRSDNGARTHEPSLRELTAEVDGLGKLMLAKIEANREILDERDKLYTERDNSRRTAVEAALTAVKEQTKASFDASEKAIVKAEEAQKSYNQSHNDLSRKLDEQNKATMPRSETETRFHSMEEKIGSIRDALVETSGQTAGRKILKDDSRANLAIFVACVGVLVAIAMAFLRH
jgi:hypothetical protein